MKLLGRAGRQRRPVVLVFVIASLFLIAGLASVALAPVVGG